MKVFLSGATGVVGRRAVDQLIAAGHEVTGLARSAARTEQLRTAGAAAAEIDLFDADAIRTASSGHDAIVNLATHIPPATKSARRQAWAENDRIRIAGSRILVDAAIANGITRYVQESIAFLYADGGGRWLDEQAPRADTMFTGAVDIAEANAQRVTDHGGAGVVLRFGMFCAPESDHMLMLVRYARRGWLALPGPADAYEPLIHADDAAAAVVAALDVAAGVYNVVDDEPLTRAEAAEALARVVGRETVRTLPGVATWLAAKRAPNLVSSQRVSNRAFKAASGWTPAHPSLREDATGIVTGAEVDQ